MAVYKFQSNEKISISKSKIIGIGLLVFCSLIFLFLFTGLVPFMQIFLMGIFGLFAYPLFITLFIVSIALINHKKYVMSLKYAIYLALCCIFLLCLIQLIILGKPSSLNFGEYLLYSYNFQYTAGGILISLILSPFLFILDLLATYIICGIGFIVCVGLILDYLYYIKKNVSLLGSVSFRKKFYSKEPPSVLTMENEDIKPVTKKQKEEIKITLNSEIEKEKLNETKNRINQIGLISGNLNPKAVQNKTPENLRDYIMSPPPVDLSKYSSFREAKNNEIQSNINNVKQDNFLYNFNQNKFQKSNPNEFNPQKVVHDQLPNMTSNFRSIGKRSPILEPLENEYSTQNTDEVLKRILDQNQKIEINGEPVKPTNISRRGRNLGQLTIDGIVKNTENQQSKNFYSKSHSYINPSIDLLHNSSIDLSTLNEDVVGKRIKLEKALEVFGIPAKVIAVVVGPAVTRYELEMPPGITVKKIITHADDIALALASNGKIRIEAPIPGRSAVGVEVPNNKIATVGIKEVLSSTEFNSNRSPLTFALGKDISGSIKICNLQKMPHLLVAGATNSGKSVCLNSILISLIYKTSPQDLRLILIDPKRVEFNLYNNLPHLLIPNVITEADKAINAFNWAINEMERRFVLFMETRVRNLEEYNQLDEVKYGQIEKLPFIVIVVDELADLMMISKKDAEEKIMRLAQKARACGIHLILATQRPSVDVITGTIKANFPSRIAFSVTSYQDSRTILDQGGAEKLLGKGDMLYSPSDASEPRRIQGCFVSGEEVEAIVNYIRNNNTMDFDNAVSQTINLKKPSQSSDVEANDAVGESSFDSLMYDALKIVIENGGAAIALLQRKLGIGFPRAGKIIDQMEQAHFISGPDGNKPRKVLISMEELDDLFGRS